MYGDDPLGQALDSGYLEGAKRSFRDALVDIAVLSKGDSFLPTVAQIITTELEVWEMKELVSLISAVFEGNEDG